MRVINKSKMINSFKKAFFRREVYVFCALFAFVGIAFLINSRAATNSVSQEVESGSVAAPALKIADPNASGGSVVQFNQSATPPPTSVTPEFTVLPIGLDAITYINPLGHMTVTFNALPQARIYMALANPSAPYPVVAPASGTVSWILGPKPDYRLEVQVSPTVKYFVDHVTLEPGMAVGARVEAGQRIAAHSGLTCCLDFGVLNTEFVAGYINRRRYSVETLNADAPLKFFAEPLRSQLYAKVNRVSGGFDGRHDYDRPGRLAGNWFLEGTPEDGSLLPEHWSKQLAFAYSNTHPSRILISIAGTLSIVNLCAVQDGAPDPAEVSVTSGAVAYRLFQKQPPVSEGDGRGQALGSLLVQLIDDNRIRVETFPGLTTGTPQFGSSARIYTR